MPDLPLQGSRPGWNSGPSVLQSMRTVSLTAWGPGARSRGSRGWSLYGSYRILWHFQCKFVQYHENFWPYNFLLSFFLSFCSHDFGPPGSRALGLGPTGPVVNPALARSMPYTHLCNIVQTFALFKGIMITLSLHKNRPLIRFNKLRIHYCLFFKLTIFHFCFYFLSELAP